MKLAYKSVVIGAMVLGVASCETTGTTYGPLQKLPNGSFILTTDFAALADKTNKVIFIEDMKPDCTFRDYPPVTVTEQPSHGTLTIRQAKDVPTAPPYDALRPACYRKPVEGILVEYTPAPGYTGWDHFAYQMAAKENSRSTAYLPGVFIRHVRAVTVQ
jgi:hypothetical protein